MAPTDRASLAARARRAYEIGRAEAAARTALAVVPMALIALPACGRPWATVANGALLYLACVALLWRGEEYGRAVVPGLAAGAAPLLLPLLARAAGQPCTVSVPFCFAGGVVAGVVVAWRAAGVHRRRAAFVVCGCLVAGAAGSLGCLYGGLAGLLGMAGGVVAGGAPVLAVARLRRL